MESLTDKMTLIQKVIADYALPPVNGHSDLTQSPDGKVITVVDVYEYHGKHYADAGLIVRIAEDRIIVERDMNNKPLVDALVQAGIPRSQIVLAYAGEALQEAA